MSLPNLTFRPELPTTVRPEFGQFAAFVQGYLGAEHRPDGTHGDVVADSLTTRGPVVLATQGHYIPSTTDTNAFGDAGPAYAFYRLTPVTNVTINGISIGTSDVTKGHAVEMVNDSAYAVTFAASSVLGPKRILTDPLTIGPFGRVRALYDVSNRGWWVTAAHPGDPIAYTPSWTAASSNPTIGNGTITGTWQQFGHLVSFAINIVMGSTTTFGTGNYSFSLPVDTATVTFGTTDRAVGPALCSDTSAPLHYVGVGRLATTTTMQAHIHNTAGPASPTVPFTWAQDDIIRIHGVYERA